MKTRWNIRVSREISKVMAMKMNILFQTLNIWLNNITKLIYQKLINLKMMSILRIPSHRSMKNNLPMFKECSSDNTLRLIEGSYTISMLDFLKELTICARMSIGISSTVGLAHSWLIWCFRLDYSWSALVLLMVKNMNHFGKMNQMEIAKIVM